MLRSLLISLSKANRVQSMIMKSKLTRRSANRFVAGEQLDDAIRVVRDLNNRNIAASLDHLGENTLRPEDAEQATSDILSTLDLIKATNIHANVSVKLTQIGLALDKILCQKNLRQILEKSKEYGNFVRIDMEESHYVEQTIALFKGMRTSGFDNLGIVIQAYLYRSGEDIQSLDRLDAKIRLCKGAYKESPELAFPKKADVDANYDRIMKELFDHAARVYDRTQGVNPLIPPIPAIATHDVARIEQAKIYAQTIGLPHEAFEFQMLYGIRRDLQESLSNEGFRVRVYVPFGTRWYPYFMRRLAERPANLWFFLSNLARR